ncbi:MAG: LysR family transcriptional regulator [Variovorax sp.]|nr:LysR family transcriptional regulator [Variovorax sp.]
MSRLPLEAFLQRKSSLVFFAGEVRGLTAGAPPAREERLLDVRELAHESFVMLSRDPSPPYHDHVVGLCAAAGFQPKVHFAAAQALTIVAIVASGHGVSLVPERSARLASTALSTSRCATSSPYPAPTWRGIRIATCRDCAA